MKRSLALFSVAALLLTGCSAEATSDSVTKEACEAFAFYVNESEQTADMDRRTTVQQVEYELTRHEGITGHQDVVDEVETLRNTIDAPDQAWVMAADAFAQRCFDTGLFEDQK